MSIVLAIETSCDETAVSIVSQENGSLCVHSNAISSQVQLHAPYGGVVPNLAAREHTKNMNLVLEEALSKANVNPDNLDLLAVTNAPGLIPALLVGTATAKTLSWLWDKPLIGIHHIEGHIYANFVSPLDTKRNKTTPQFPLLALVVSGGHTQLVYMKKHFHYEIIGQTQDDAVGEAFDKVARILGLRYPGGPEIAKKAHLYRGKRKDFSHETLSEEIILPRPMINSNNFHFSFSGLKTAVLYAVQTYRKEHTLEETESLPDSFVEMMSWQFEEASIDVLTTKALRALHQYQPKSVVLAGGVSANLHLQKTLRKKIDKLSPQTIFFLPPLGLSLDNAAMIGACALLRWEKMSTKEKVQAKNTWKSLETYANLSLTEISR
ncbi:MAG: tRNA (adenosine(37)-N6)-threonylcarbamoyltransferase complex transferase subunit TsaD [Candidatus Moranbacteria bacterium]|nr:tRNA (adenosine(37)-N6)-threonylcarbamoyltransferase complex transferase subunit TsaD [Candidatus Moranbacteria bacterium]